MLDASLDVSRQACEVRNGLLSIHFDGPQTSSMVNVKASVCILILCESYLYLSSPL